MIKIEINAKDIQKEIELSIRAFEILDEGLDGKFFTDNIWPQAREKIIEYLRGNLEDIHEYQIDSKWQNTKTELMNTPFSVENYKSVLAKNGFAGFTTQRFIGGTWERIISDDAFKSTGVMDEVINQQLTSDNFSMQASRKSILAELDVDVSNLIDEYPLIIDEKIMEISGNYAGLVRLYASQQNELINMLVTETSNISEEIFGKK